MTFIAKTRETNLKRCTPRKKGVTVLCHRVTLGCHTKYLVKRQKGGTLNVAFIVVSFDLSYLSPFFINSKKNILLDYKTIKNSLIEYTYIGRRKKRNKRRRTRGFIINKSEPKNKFFVYNTNSKT